jgi:ABC-type branched-subunit amino acid transport system ATPase component
MPEAMLEVKNLSKSFGGIRAVNNCSFDVRKGKITALIGPNGAGKTTIFNIISGFVEPDKGKITFEGENITELKPFMRALLGISRTFQIMRLFPKMTVMENMLLAMPDKIEDLKHALFRTRMMHEQEHKNEVKAMEWLEFVGLHAKVDELAGNLSYGQQKLLEIAKTLASDPELVMLDEPASGVNPTMLNKIGELIVKLKERGKTVLIIEHNMEFVMDIADRVVVLDYGKEIAVGTPEQVRRSKKVIDAYLGVTK